ncbi:hypothetical protein Tco_0253107 [Tanacetum coccineum]
MFFDVKERQGIDSKGFLEFFDCPGSRQGVEDLREVKHRKARWEYCTKAWRFKVGFKQLGPGVEAGIHEVHDEKRVLFGVELQGAHGDREAEVFQVSNDDTAVAQRWLEDKQPKDFAASCNLDLKVAREKRFLQLHELDELRLQAYENSKLYKARTKAYHDKKLIVRKEFKAGDKLNELTIEEIHLMCEEGIMKAIPFMAPFPVNYCETMPWASEKPYIYSVVENTCNKAKLYDLDEYGKGIVIKNILYVPSKGSSLEKK